ncbi:hypothetical protein EG68_05118 [Paragonimus skrjabini miyazakii]|uniref:Uncharacterized protein n=1 Tax=Paragonimus skrjabini miyazakii TaxID=59628 RepID=A0A8S9YSD6_9TREM|nr:hypothetical protein EG68_05118 [Paragonimus skrjabini miyazakii]
MLVQDPNTLFDRGCVEPLSRFIQQYWMGLHLVPLLVVILTMIPQMFLLLTTIQPKQLRIQSIEACIDFGNHMENRIKQFQMVGRGMFSMLSKSSTQFSRPSHTFDLIEDDDDVDEDYYKAVRAEVAASEREIYDKGNDSRQKERKTKKKKDKNQPPEIWEYSNWKPSSHLESRQSQMDRVSETQNLP